MIYNMLHFLAYHWACHQTSTASHRGESVDRERKRTPSPKLSWFLETWHAPREKKMGQHGCVCAVDKVPRESMAQGRRPRTPQSTSTQVKVQAARGNVQEELTPTSTCKSTVGTSSVSHRHKVLCFRDEMDRTDDLWKRLSLIVIHIVRYVLGNTPSSFQWPWEAALHSNKKSS